MRIDAFIREVMSQLSEFVPDGQEVSFEIRPKVSVWCDNEKFEGGISPYGEKTPETVRFKIPMNRKTFSLSKN